MSHFIITADDYGMCDDVSKAIERLAKRGMLTSTNVLTNFGTDYLNSAIRDYPNFSVGIHWNVTTGYPTLPCSEIPSLVKDNGEFHSIEEFRTLFNRGKIVKEELIRELESQFDIFFKFFGLPDYWNTHENLGLQPKEYLVFQSVAKRKGIKGTRNFQRVYIDYDKVGSTKRKIREFGVSSFINLWYGIYAKKSFVMPDARIVCFENKSKSEYNRIMKCVTTINTDCTEIVIHPALDGNNPLFGNIGEDRLIEFERFMSEDYYKLFHSEGIDLVSFEYLSRRRK